MTDQPPWVAPGSGTHAPPPAAPGLAQPPPTDVPVGPWAQPPQPSRPQPPRPHQQPEQPPQEQQPYGTYPAHPPYPPYPPDPSPLPPGRRRRRGAGIVLIVVASLVVLGLVGTGLVVLRGRGNADSSTGSSSSPAADLDDVVTEISAFVEEERGLEFLRDVEVELADDEEFERRLLEDFDERRADLAETELVFQALGFIEPDTDLAEELESSLSSGVVGFYDPETDELVVRGTETTPYVRTTIAHELVHALDDQHFELDRPDVDESDGEEGFGFTALVEGDAVQVEERYLDALSSAERAEYLAEEAEIAASFPAFSVPPVLIEMLVAPYTLGLPLVEAVLDDGDQEALDAAFAAPPVTSEQVMVPEKFLEGEGPVATAAPAADGDVLSEGAFGAFLLGLLLERELDASDVDEAVTGWGGDAYVAWVEQGEACLRATFVGDTTADTAELADAVEEWADEDGDATTTTTTSTDGGAPGVSLERCG